MGCNDAGNKRGPVAWNLNTLNNHSLAPVEFSALSRARRSGIGVVRVISARGMVTAMTELIAREDRNDLVDEGINS
jgi:hypothetical protein